MSGAQPEQVRWRVPVERLRIHQAIIDRISLTASDVLLDLGCGNGFTLATAARRAPGLSMIGIDLDTEVLAAAQRWLKESGARCQWFAQDVQKPLPLADASVTRVVCHDVLEYLEDPDHLLTEGARVMRPGAVSVWSHVDYEALLIGGADRVLTRRIVTAYADARYLNCSHTDAQVARKLATMVDRSPLTRVGIDAAVLIATSFVGPGRHRVDDIAATVSRSASQGDVDLEPEEVRQWVGSLERAEERGEFFYSHTAYMVTALNGDV